MLGCRGAKDIRYEVCFLSILVAGMLHRVL